MPITTVLVVIKGYLEVSFICILFTITHVFIFFLDEALCDCKEERCVHVNLGDQGLFQSIYIHLVENRSVAAE